MQELSIKVYPSNQRLDKDWFVQYRHPHKEGLQKKYGRLKHLHTLEEKLAEVEKLIQEIKADCFSPEAKVNFTLLKHLYEIVEMRFLNRKVKTRDAYMGFFNMFKRWYMEEGKGKDFETMGYSYSKYILKCGLCNRTHNNHIKTLRSFFNDLLSFFPSSYLINPFKNIRIIPTNSNTKQWFKPFDVKRLKSFISATDPQLWLACLVEYYCFIRPGEIRHLKIESINFEKSTFQLKADETKNRRNDIVLIPPDLLAILSQYKNLPDNYFLFGMDGQPGPVQLGKDNLSKRHQLILKKLKFAKGYSFYSWKNTGAVEMVKNGTHMKALSLMIRHSDITTTDMYLQSLSIDDLISQYMIKYTTI